jgi:hypothetical protein
MVFCILSILIGVVLMMGIRTSPEPPTQSSADFPYMDQVPLSSDYSLVSPVGLPVSGSSSPNLGSATSAGECFELLLLSVCVFRLLICSSICESV